MPTKPHPLVMRLVAPTPRDLTLYEGYLGGAEGPGLQRLYLDRELRRWLVIPEEDIVHVERRSGSGSALEPDLVWVTRGAAITRSEPERAGEEPALGDTPQDEPALSEEREPIPIAILEAVLDEAVKGSDDKAIQKASDALESSLKDELEPMVRARLGPAHRTYDIRFERGSLEVLAFVGAVGGAVQAYEGIRKGLDLLVGDFKRLLAFLLKRGNVEGVEVKSATWTQGSGLIAIAPAEAPGKSSRLQRLTRSQDPLVVYALMVLTLLLVFVLGVIVVLLVDALPSTATPTP